MKQGLSRDDSLAVKGIAVLMLLFHHLYCSTGRFDGYAVSFFPFSEESIVELALLFKNCVSIFAFISGYGLLKSIAAAHPAALGLLVRVCRGLSRHALPERAAA